MWRKNILLIGLTMGLVAFVSVVFTVAFMTNISNESKISFGTYEYKEIEKLDSVILFKKTFPDHHSIFNPTSASGEPTVIYLVTDAFGNSGGNDLLLEVEGKYTYDKNNHRIFETTEKLICDKRYYDITITNFVIEDESFFYEKNLVLDCLDDYFD